MGGQPLDTLQAWVAELFSSVPSGKGPRPAFAHAGLPYEVSITSPCATWGALLLLGHCHRRYPTGIFKDARRCSSTLLAHRRGVSLCVIKSTGVTVRVDAQGGRLYSLLAVLKGHAGGPCAYV